MKKKILVFIGTVTSFSVLFLSLLAFAAQGQVSKTNLISDVQAVGDDAVIMMGLHIALNKGWKTYWRSPGDAGIPPQFNWSGSQNIEKVEVLWPKPIEFSSAGLSSWGYKDEVVFPLRVTLKQPGHAVRANLDVFYGVCEMVCIPVKQEVALSLPQGPAVTSKDAPLIKLFAERVPLLLSMSNQVHDMKVKSNGSQELMITIKSDLQFNNPALILEGEQGDFFQISPKTTNQTAGYLVFTATADLARKGSPLKGRKITATILDKGVAVEGQITVK
ncbi:protein-disulfide reductase DsbD domain-containing protein [Sneathiella sp.]|jgi:suppressor for copper-sensitivity B|uniref:protein-disulfide reductase DsbD domain-containing protein n=1 Tax=Sneathiella sp. TaxID=1964365 RepID=UPI0039E4EC08